MIKLLLWWDRWLLRNGDISFDNVSAISRPVKNYCPPNVYRSVMCVCQCHEGKRYADYVKWPSSSSSSHSPTAMYSQSAMQCAVDKGLITGRPTTWQQFHALLLPSVQHVRHMFTASSLPASPTRPSMFLPCSGTCKKSFIKKKNLRLVNNSWIFYWDIADKLIIWMEFCVIFINFHLFNSLI